METIDGSQRLKSHYQKKRDYWLSKHDQLQKRSTVIAWLRLALFIIAFAIPFSVFKAWSLFFFISWFSLFAIFLSSIYYAYTLSQKRKVAQLYLNLFDKELRILKGNWTGEVDGAELINPNHDFSHDLDLFGKGSLFQFINRTSTKGGYLKLAHKLNTISLDPEEIKLKQKGINELSSLEEFRAYFYVLGNLIEEGNKKKKPIELDTSPDLSMIKGKLKYLIIAFPIIVLSTIALSVFSLIPSAYILYLFFTGLGITAHFLRKINGVHNKVSELGGYLNHYSKLIKHLEDQNVNSSYLKSLKQKLGGKGHTASQIVRKLSKIIQVFDQRLNMLLGALLNGFFLWDLLVCIALNNWYAKYKAQLSIWMDTLHEMEALISFATFKFNHPDFNFPETSKDIVFEASELGHPLIPAKERINNYFEIKERKRICVITGANMAGKSTFLRTVGVNLVLAGNGSVVAAKALKYKPLTFVTNMRAVDNLLKHESYFFAELSRLQMIVERLNSKGELFFILDEILKGTNSHDKTNGSKALVQQLLLKNGTGIIATHDLELGELAKKHPGKVFNNCFEVTFKSDSLSFDYKLRSGVTQSHNASFLMRKMGLIPSN